MRGVIDRIEDGKTAVVTIEGGGQMFIPVKQFDFKVHEGAHIDIEFKLNPEREKRMRQDIKNLQQELLERTEQQEKDEKS